MSAEIPLADAVELRRRARPARLFTALLAAAAIGCAVAALLVARGPRTRTLVPLGHNSNAVMVLDLSASISADTFSRIGGTLRTLSTSNGHFALVIFSDLAYEALPPGTPAADHFDLLALVIEDYERKHWSIDPPDPVEAIRYRMETGGLSQADLGRLLGSRQRSSDILSRRRRLTMQMAWKLHHEWDIPAEALLKPTLATRGQRAAS